jgi:hypothetical protein
LFQSECLKGNSLKFPKVINLFAAHLPFLKLQSLKKVFLEVYHRSGDDVGDQALLITGICSC